MITNLPEPQSNDSAKDVRLFFDKFFLHEVSFPAAEIDAVVGFFLKRGFDDSSSKSVSIVLCNQARQDNVNVFQLVDTLKGLDDVQLSQVVAEVLNAYREKTSVLGYKTAVTTNAFEARNIIV